MANERVLVVDDNDGLCTVLNILLTKQGFQVRVAPSGELGLEIFETWSPDLVITDLQLPGISGLDLLRAARAATVDVGGRPVPVILMTAFGTVATAVSAMRDGAFDYITKPFANDELRMIVARALEMRRLTQENDQLRRELKARFQLGEFIGASPRMQSVYELVRQVMGTRIGVLILGESGTGKELLARSIHYGSDRAQGPFVPVNCGAISESLWESELFGYRRGAFTGAMKDKQGFFSAASGGTLFLDEVGEMPLTAQVKLLRALAERKVTPVGATAEESVDVRIIAATNRNLAREVKEGRFREDLYYRLNVVSVEMPPLRERPEDIEELARHFVARYTKEYGRETIRGVNPEAMRLLRGYGWPGNVRELQGVLERAVALERGTLISAGSLPDRIQGGLTPTSEEAESASLPTEGIDLEARLADVERQYLVRALHSAAGNRTQAAKLLGVTYRSLRYRLAKFGMDEETLSD